MTFDEIEELIVQGAYRPDPAKFPCPFLPSRNEAHELEYDMLFDAREAYRSEQSRLNRQFVSNLIMAVMTAQPALDGSLARTIVEYVWFCDKTKGLDFVLAKVEQVIS